MNRLENMFTFSETFMHKSAYNYNLTSNIFKQTWNPLSVRLSSNIQKLFHCIPRNFKPALRLIGWNKYLKLFPFKSCTSLFLFSITLHNPFSYGSFRECNSNKKMVTEPGTYFTLPCVSFVTEPVKRVRRLQNWIGYIALW